LGTYIKLPTFNSATAQATETLAAIMKIIASILCTFISLPIYGQVIYPFSSHGKWFFVDSNFKQIERKSYSFIEPKEFNYFAVKKKKKWALYNKTGKRITNFQFDRITFDSFLRVFYSNVNELPCNIDTNGKVFPRNTLMAYCGGVGYFNMYFRPYDLNHKIGFYIYTDDMKVTHPDTVAAIYDEYLENCNGFAFVKINNLWGMINEKGNYVLSPQFDNVARNKLCEGGTIVIQDNLYGWINWQGQLAIRPKYKNLAEFKLGYSFVTTTDNKTGYITEMGLELFK